MKVLLLLIFLIGIMTPAFATPSINSSEGQWSCCQIESIYRLLDETIANQYPEYNDPEYIPGISGDYIQHLSPGIEYLSLSPDGTVVLVGALVRPVEPESAIDQADFLLCHYTLDTAELSCKVITAVEEYRMLWNLERANIVWSPDGSNVYFHEKLNFLNQESDLWQLDVEALTWTNLTNDAIDGDWIQAILDGSVLEVQLDYLPIVDSSNGDLYFFRSKISKENMTHLLCRLPSGSTEPEVLYEFPESLIQLDSVYDDFLRQFEVALAPDGSYLAIVSRPSYGYEGYAIWLLSLSHFELTELVSLEKLNAVQRNSSARPGEITENIEQIYWSGNSQYLIVDTGDFDAGFFGLPRNIISVNIVDGELVHLISDSRNPLGTVGLESVRVTLLSPNRDTLFFFPFLSYESTLPVYEVPIDLQGTPMLIGQIHESFSAINDLPPSEDIPVIYQVAPNGRVLIGHYLLTFNKRE